MSIPSSSVRFPALSSAVSPPPSDAESPSRRVSTVAAAVAAAAASTEASSSASRAAPRNRRASADDAPGLKRFDVRKLKPLERSAATDSVSTVSPMHSPAPSPMSSPVASAAGEPVIVTCDSLPAGLEYDETTQTYSRTPPLATKEDAPAEEARAAAPAASSIPARTDALASAALFPLGAGRRTSAPSLGGRFSRLDPLSEAPRPNLKK